MLFCVMATKKKVKQVVKGKNVRFTDEGHNQISDYCREMGFNLGKFCERAAITQISVIKPQ